MENIRNKEVASKINVVENKDINTTIKKIQKAKIKLQKINTKKLEEPTKLEINKTELNDFFVSVFYSILRDEESKMNSYSNGNLSIKEIHLLQTVSDLEKIKSNTASSVANGLNITQGSLTVAVNVLEQKGYLIKQKDNTDKRVTYLTLSQVGKDIIFIHENYHINMINKVTATLNKKQQIVLLEALQNLSQFFKNN